MCSKSCVFALVLFLAGDLVGLLHVGMLYLLELNMLFVSLCFQVPSLSPHFSVTADFFEQPLSGFIIITFLLLSMLHYLTELLNIFVITSALVLFYNLIHIISCVSPSVSSRNSSTVKLSKTIT